MVLPQTLKEAGGLIHIGFAFTYMLDEPVLFKRGKCAVCGSCLSRVGINALA